MTVSKQVFHPAVNNAAAGLLAEKLAWEVSICEVEAREEAGRSVVSNMMNRAETSEARNSECLGLRML
jgi:hypothetical protein